MRVGRRGFRVVRPPPWKMKPPGGGPRPETGRGRKLPGDQDLRLPPWKANPPGAGTRSKRAGRVSAGDQGLRFPQGRRHREAAVTGLNPAGRESAGVRVLRLPLATTQLVDGSCLMNRCCSVRFRGGQPGEYPLWAVAQPGESGRLISCVSPRFKSESPD
jgi:hypothetical protein